MTVQTAGAIPELTLGQRLTVAMEYGGYKSETMALQMRCAATTIRNYITGRTQIDYPALRAWAEITGVSLEWLETGYVPTGGPGGALPQHDSNVQPFGSWLAPVVDLRSAA